MPFQRYHVWFWRYDVENIIWLRLKVKRSPWMHVQGPKLYKCAKFDAFYEKVSIIFIAQFNCQAAKTLLTLDRMCV